MVIQLAQLLKWYVTTLWKVSEGEEVGISFINAGPKKIYGLYQFNRGKRVKIVIFRYLYLNKACFVTRFNSVDSVKLFNMQSRNTFSHTRLPLVSFSQLAPSLINCFHPPTSVVFDLLLFLLPPGAQKMGVFMKEQPFPRSLPIHPYLLTITTAATYL